LTRRAANGWRRYGPDDLMCLNSISVHKSLGLTLAQIRKLLRETAPSLSVINDRLLTH
jgi:DNA-binding transcriptional MerR regulator